MNHISQSEILRLISLFEGWEDSASVEISLTPLSGGLTNRSYVIRRKGRKYVFRLAGDKSEVLGINRANELQSTRIASEEGIGLSLEGFLLPQGHMMTRWSEGKSWTIEDFRKDVNWKKAAILLARVHSLNPVSGEFDPYRDIEERIAALQGKELPENLNDYLSLAKRIKVEREGGPLGGRFFCHNDPFFNNFMDCGDRVLLLDWEFSGSGDPLFDVASATQVLGEEERDTFLTFYLDHLNVGTNSFPEMKAHLEKARFIVMFWSGLWALVQSELDHIEHDYGKMAEGIFRKMDDYLKGVRSLSQLERIIS